MNSPWYFKRNILLVLAIIFCLCSLAISLLPPNKDLFSGSGAVTTVAGLFLNIKHTMIFHLKIPLINKYHLRAGAFGFGVDELSEEQEKRIKSILSDEKYGVSFMLTGTIIWTYGTYLVELLKNIIG